MMMLVPFKRVSACLTDRCTEQRITRNAHGYQPWAFRIWQDSRILDFDAEHCKIISRSTAA
jgi:hypothetical protein